jgi:hypothetical protein
LIGTQAWANDHESAQSYLSDHTKDGFGLADDGAAAGINSGADDEQTGRNPKVRVADHTSVVRGGPNSAKVFPAFVANVSTTGWA